MEFRQLGSSGMRVSALGLGGNNFGWRLGEAQSVAVIQRALDVGINHIDTADMYKTGVSEEYVGKAISGRREQVVLATKMGFPMGEGTNESGMSYRRVVAACEASLRRLQTDHIDIYYMHTPDPTTPLAETLRAFDQLVREGKIRYVGISNHAAWQVCEALWISDRRGYQAPIVTENQYNLLDRGVEAELLPLAKAHGLGIIPWYPLAAGLLTGKYRRGEAAPAGVRGASNPALLKRLDEPTQQLIDRLERFARHRDHALADLAIAWLLGHPEIPSVIAGAMNRDQVDANVKAAAWRLSADEMAEVEGILKGADVA